MRELVAQLCRLEEVDMQRTGGEAYALSAPSSASSD